MKEGRDTLAAAKSDTAPSASLKTQILLAEDNVGNQLVALTILEEMGCEVDIANNGMEALNQYRSKRYDIVLMDIQMPVLDGFAATRAIREEERAHQLDRVPIVALTAHAISGYREKCLGEGGMDAYLSKPFSIEELKATVSAILTASQVATHRQATAGKGR